MASQAITGPSSLTIGPTDTFVTAQYFAAKLPATWTATVLSDGVLSPSDYTVTISSSGLLTVTIHSGVVIPPEGVTMSLNIHASSGPGTGNNADHGVTVQVDHNVVPCFVEGTLIDTVDGPRFVEDLNVGDLVLTQSGGPQPLRWIGRRQVSADEFTARQSVRPVVIRKDAFGPDRPSADLKVSPSHRIVVEGWAAEMIAGTESVLVQAAHLINDHSVRRCTRPVDFIYYHLLFDHHEVIIANDLPTESLFLGEMARTSFPKADLLDLERLYPAVITHFSNRATVLPCLRRHEAAPIAQMMLRPRLN